MWGNDMAEITDGESLNKRPARGRAGKFAKMALSVLGAFGLMQTAGAAESAASGYAREEAGAPESGDLMREELLKGITPANILALGEDQKETGIAQFTYLFETVMKDGAKNISPEKINRRIQEYANLCLERNAPEEANLSKRFGEKLLAVFNGGGYGALQEYYESLAKETAIGKEVLADIGGISAFLGFDRLSDRQVRSYYAEIRDVLEDTIDSGVDGPLVKTVILEDTVDYTEPGTYLVQRKISDELSFRMGTENEETVKTLAKELRKDLDGRMAESYRDFSLQNIDAMDDETIKRYGEPIKEALRDGFHFGRVKSSTKRDIRMNCDYSDNMETVYREVVRLSKESGGKEKMEAYFNRIDERQDEIWSKEAAKEEQSIKTEKRPPENGRKAAPQSAWASTARTQQAQPPAAPPPPPPELAESGYVSEENATVTAPKSFKDFMSQRT